MGKWGTDNQICVKITIRKGCNDWEVIYYRNKLPMWIIEQWRWYFDYLAALVKVNNPRLKVELTTCAQTLKQGQEYIEEIRHFIAAMNKQFEQGGILISRIRFHRSETGTVEDIYIDYEERDNQTGGKDDE